MNIDYDEGKFSETDIFQPENPDGNGKAIDKKGIKIKVFFFSL